MKSLALLGVAAFFIAGAWMLLARRAHTLPAELAAPGKPVHLPREGGKVFGEGVVSDWQGNVYFNEMKPNNRTLQVRAGEDTVRVWRQAGDAPNGLWLDSENRILICQARALVRVRSGAVGDGHTDTLYKYAKAGRDFNDVTGDSMDNLYFTNFAGRSVFYRDAVSGETREVLSDRPRPNGIEWDEARKAVYVCEGEAGKVAVYEVAPDHSLIGRRDFADVPGADGITLDSAGNVYAVAFGEAVRVYTPDGTRLGEIPLSGSELTNLAFGGSDFRTLYMITNIGLYKLPMRVKGYGKRPNHE